MNQKQKQKTGKLDETEVTAAIENAGYPFELRVFERLSKAGMMPSFGMRFRSDDADTREVDIVTAREISFPANGQQVTGTLITFVEAKKVHDGAFVGFLLGKGGAYATGAELDFVRTAPVAGIPSWGVWGNRYENHVEMMLKLSPAFSALNAAPVCLQWTLAKRRESKDGVAYADQEKGVYDDLAGLVRVIGCHAIDLSKACLRVPTPILPMLHFLQGALVLDCPLYTYDVSDPDHPALKSVASMIVQTSQGVQTRFIDVVSIDGLDAWIKRCGKTVKALERLLTEDERGSWMAPFGKAMRDELLRELPPGVP